ncbi:hypothetical protein [Conexibacter woesei]|uniref:hypothetical protein n=1 Tax=Conexibacter woesei TaxID=191495 RepID=UPI00047D7780|nr:hypothetical protein [Conexibacter woesei]
MSEVIHLRERRFAVAPWRGTPSQIVRAIERAAEMVAQEMGAEPDSASLEAEIRYPDGRAAYGTLSALRQSIADVSVQQVREIEATVGWADPPHSVHVLASVKEGVVVTCSSPNEVLALGVAQILEQMLDEGRMESPYRDEHRPPRWYEWVLGAALLALYAYIAYRFIQHQSWLGTKLDDRTLNYVKDHGSVDLWNVGSMVFATVVALFLGLGAWVGTLQERPSVEFIRVEDPAQASRRPAWSVRVEAWLRTHPLANVLFGFVLGILANGVSNLIF